MAERPRITPAGAAAPATPPPAPPEAFAALATAPPSDEGVVVSLPDGRTVLLERPKGSVVARGIIIASELVSEMQIGAMAQAVALASLRPYIEALFHVKALEGKRIAPIANAEAYQKLADNIGDDGIDVIQVAIFKHWPPPNATQREAVKKNLQGQQLS